MNVMSVNFMNVKNYIYPRRVDTYISMYVYGKFQLLNYTNFAHDQQLLLVYHLTTGLAHLYSKQQQ